MASKKNLKKDINFLVEEAISTCLVHQELQQDKTNENLNELIEEILIFREEMIKKANNPELNDNHKSLRAYYNHLNEHLVKHINEVFEKIN